MFDQKKFRAVLILTGKTLNDVAGMLEISLVTLYRKMNGESDFYRHEIFELCEYLKINDPKEIFFAKEIT